MKMTLAWVLTMGVSGLSSGQGTKLVYDVVSVKPNNAGGGMRMMMSPEGIEATNTTLHMMMVNAYQVDADRVLGLPGWGDTAHWDVKAKVAEADLPALKALPLKERPKLMQAALEDRFKLVSHRETRELPVYELVQVKDGTKLKEAKKDDTPVEDVKRFDGKTHPGMMRMGRDGIDAQAIPIKNLISALSGTVHRPVIDKTGLTGEYDITLKWTPEDAPAGGDDHGPSIYTAVEEQLGLKLVATKAMVEVLVVDSVEKPSED